jgi:hypothetical protein
MAVSILRALASCALLGVFAAGCILIESSESISTSVSQSVESISTSLEAMSGSFESSSDEGEGGATEAYRRDVSDLTVACVVENVDAQTFLADLAGVAEQHGITHWEREPDTYRAIGAGLKRAGIPQTDLRGVESRLGSAPREVGVALREGYGS